MFIVESGGFYLSELPLRQGSWRSDRASAHVFKTFGEFVDATLRAGRSEPTYWVGDYKHWIGHEVQLAPQPRFELTGKTL